MTIIFIDGVFIDPEHVTHVRPCPDDPTRKTVLYLNNGHTLTLERVAQDVMDRLRRAERLTGEPG